MELLTNGEVLFVRTEPGNAHKLGTSGPINIPSVKVLVKFLAISLRSRH